MPNGFPEGKFRIVNLKSGQCLYKKTGLGRTLGKPGPPLAPQPPARRA
ncbi:hypothetical protein [Streptomyces syringium]